MANKLFRLLYNGIRGIGNPVYFRLAAVEPTTRISRASGAVLNIGKGFRSRHHVEINVRDNAVLEIGNNVFLNSGCIITARERVQIGDNTIFGPNVVIYDHDHEIRDGKILDNGFITAPVTIGANAWIGAGSVILKGARIGDNCVIAAGSVVTGTVEKGHVLVQKRKSEFRAISEPRKDGQCED